MSSNVTSYDFGTIVNGNTTSATSSFVSTFTRTVFDTSFQGRAEILNTAQYGSLAIFPMMFFAHGLHVMVPDPNYTATTVMIVLEMVYQIVLTLLGFILIHRLITLVPNLSGVAYERVNFVGLVLPMLLVLFSLNSKLGAKGRLVMERIGWYPSPVPSGAPQRHPSTLHAAAHPGIPSSSAGTMMMHPSGGPAETRLQPMSIR